MEGEAIEGALPLPESGLILSGPDDDIFDNIFDWIANAVSKITSVVIGWVSRTVIPFFGNITDWIKWLWNNITGWFKRTWDTFTDWIDWLWGKTSSWFKTTWDTITDWISWLRGEILGWFKSTWDTITDWTDWLWNNITSWFETTWDTISGWFTALYAQLESWFTWLIGEVETRILAPLTTWWDQFLERVFDVGAWVGKLLDAVWAWLSEDIPGHSIRWQDIVKGWWDLTWGAVINAWKLILAEGLEAIPQVMIDRLSWLGDLFSGVFETFMEAIMGLVREIGPTNPSIAVGSYSAMAKVGMVALGGLAGMTMAGSWLKPLGGAGMGQIAAMIYDMTNYKLITGVFMGALTVAMLRQPLTYHFNEIFRPYILRIGDFMELMARDAWSHPELLREPTLTESVGQLTRGAGTAFEQKMIGYYGYPAQYYGLFKELSFAPLRYFPLAGIARVGYWDEAWFTEALSRSGYSPTAREALLDMYREQVLTARQLPVMSQIRRLSREGFATMEEIKVHLEKAAGMETLTESRFFAMELEQEFARKEMAFDIMMSAFSRGITPEAEARRGLGGLGIPSAMLDLHFMREKLGLLRRISIPTEPAAPAIIGVEE